MRTLIVEAPRRSDQGFLQGLLSRHDSSLSRLGTGVQEAVQDQLTNLVGDAGAGELSSSHLFIVTDSDNPVGAGLLIREDAVSRALLLDVPDESDIDALAMLAVEYALGDQQCAVASCELWAAGELASIYAKQSRVDWDQHPVKFRDYRVSDAAGVAALCRGERWSTYASTAVAEQGCAAPGVTTVVAIAKATGTVAGFAQVLSDGVAQGYLAQLIIHPSYRRRGIARTLVQMSYEKSGAQRLDLLTDDAQAFYETFEGHAKPGYRIYPDR